jgi:predicted metal-dependent HD superfamily phosphohydrolase
MDGLVFDAHGFGSTNHFIHWDDVMAVGIRTTDTGPFTEDLFWQFLTADGLLEVPGLLIDGEALDALFAALPGLDSEKVIGAMSSTRVRVFRVWSRERAGSTDREKLRARFVSLVQRLGGDAGAAKEVGTRLLVAWSEPHRRYHDLEHLTECLHWLDRSQPAAATAASVELALWFHDAVYRPGARDNEVQSAGLLTDASKQLGLSSGDPAAAARWVLETGHEKAGASCDSTADLVLDIDLAILGSDPLRFLEYEYGIQEEFGYLGALRLELGRGKFLRALLDRPAIYRTAFFRTQLETRARANLTGLLASPSYRRFRMVEHLRAGFRARRPPPTQA